MAEDFNSALANRIADQGASTYEADMEYWASKKKEASFDVDEAIEFFLKTGFVGVPLREWMREESLTEQDLKALNSHVKPVPIHVAKIEAMADIQSGKSILLPSKDKRGTDVWRELGEGRTVTNKVNHVFAVKWVRTGGGSSGRGVGDLHVAFRTTGEREYKGQYPVYRYSGVPYDTYYEIYKRLHSPGKSVWYGIIQRYAATKLGMFSVQGGQE